MTHKADSLLPFGHSFVDDGSMLISNEGREVLDDIVNKTDAEDPRMYRYHDWHGSAITSILDKYVATLHSKVAKQAYDEAYSVLEGVTVFMVNDDSWCDHDDGERIVALDKAFGALAIAVFQGLEQEGELDTFHFPGLEGLMKTIAEWNEAMCDTFDLDYYLYIKYLGEKLFKDKTAEDFELEKARQQEWIKTLPKEERRDARARFRDASGPNDKPWYEGGKDNHADYSRKEAWKAYKKLTS